MENSAVALKYKDEIGLNQDFDLLMQLSPNLDKKAALISGEMTIGIKSWSPGVLKGGYYSTEFVLVKRSIDKENQSFELIISGSKEAVDKAVKRVTVLGRAIL